jgi:BMFP domain-containing protein YqiC
VTVHSTYRTDLRDLNELNFARFDAKLEQRVAELDAKIETVKAELRAEMQAGFRRAESLLEQRMAELETRLTRRLFNFWIAQAATTVALVFGVVKLVR